jgi:hypothetical protein
MTGIRFIAGTLVSFALSVGAFAADVRTIQFSQKLEPPAGQTFTRFADRVAIDGADIIVIARYQGGQSALLYQRASGSSRFTYRSTLLTFADPQEDLQVRMKNGIAVVKFGAHEWIFEKSGSSYVPGEAATSLDHPGGVAISGNRILFGGDGCDYDGVVYQKGGDGRWQITGRLDDDQGQCVTEGLAVELNYDYAVLHAPGAPQATTWRRNGSALAWVSAGNLPINAEVAATSAPFALQNATLVTPASYVFRREGGAWSPKGRVVPVDYGMGTGNATAVKYRDGVLATAEHWTPNYANRVYLYQEMAPAQFEHLAVLDVVMDDFDISGRTVVVAVPGPNNDDGTPSSAYRTSVIFTLPDPLAATDTIATGFEDGDASDFSVVSGQFAVEQREYSRVLAQNSNSGYNVALVENSDAANYQYIEAIIGPTSVTPEGWRGLIARYTDANNYYYVAIRENGSGGLYRRLNGVNTLVKNWAGSPGQQRVSLRVDTQSVVVTAFGVNVAVAVDPSARRGRAGLVTYHAGADFDEVLVNTAGPTTLLSKWFLSDSDIPARREGREFSRIGGDWQYIEPSPDILEGYQQRDPGRSAFAFIGTPVRNQEIDVSVRVDAVSSPTGAWVGLLGRYVDARTYYYATVGNNHRAEIRKSVNGVVTLLAATSRAVDLSQFNTMRFRLVDEQLQLFLNDERVLSVYDGDIAEGAHGLATNRSAATWQYMKVEQP